LETFTEFKDFVANPRYNEQRQQSLSRLDIDQIDPPIIELISAFAKLPYCFTLQSCYGHFLHSRQKVHYNIEALPITDSILRARARITYHFGIPASGYLWPILIRKILEIACYSCGFAQSDRPNLTQI